MSSLAAFAAVEDYLKDVWNITPIVFENEEVIPPTDGLWLFVEMTGSLYQQASIGGGSPDDNLWREAGTLWLHVMMPAFRGTREGRDIAWQLVQLLTRQPIPGIEFGDANVGSGQPAVTIDGSFAAMTATIDWERDE